MKAAYYSVDQSLPPGHWYQKRVGWFGKAFLSLVILSIMGGATYGYVLNRNNAGYLASQTNSDKLRKTAATIENGPAENIIDIQFVLDKWAEDNEGQTWSVAAKSLNGPSFDASINQDKSYESRSMRQLFMTIPLFSQIPPEHQKSMTISLGGKQQPLANCVDLMIRLSHDVCAGEVARFVDFNKAGDQMQKAGLQKTSYKGDIVKTTAADTIRYLTWLHGDALNRTARDMVLQLLREQTVRDGIPGGCPGCVTANMTDGGDNPVHDAAIIEYNGGTYVLSIYTKDGSFDQLSQIAGRIQQKILDTTSN